MPVWGQLDYPDIRHCGTEGHDGPSHLVGVDLLGAFGKIGQDRHRRLNSDAKARLARLNNILSELRNDAKFCIPARRRIGNL